MSRFKQELRVIPRALRIIVAFVLLGLSSAFTLFVMFSHDPGLAHTPGAAKLLMIVGVGIVPAIWLLLIGYVYSDAKRRGMRYVMWTLLAIFIPNAIGIILYFILRDPLMKPCPGCSQVLKSGYTFCPHCGTSLLPTCPNCGRGVELGWANCPACGTKLPSPSPPAA
ncbi:MAG TPA: zinc ribbon domain-containing protein [Candidatus Acidoferrales bacterium]|nr:zinc ribbon domain-containing protein [Candidatus Acidoferrales bacterium]